MSDERERCLLLLGLKPGASTQEIKAAYRDLAKVWHPDRFAHDPRLQEKAQNKLKEINEAYEALTSPGFTRRTRRTAAATAHSATGPASSTARPRHEHAGNNSHWVMLIFFIVAVAAVLLFITPQFLQSNDGEAGHVSATAAPSATGEEVEKGDEAASNRKERKSVEKQKASTVDSAAVQAEPEAQPRRALPTVTVTIDPTTGQLATASCPIKSSMTYVEGREPHQYCSASHPPPQEAEARTEVKNRSQLKTLANRLSAPARWLKNRGKQPAEQNSQPTP